MKQLIILLMMIAGWAGCAFAQTDAKNPATNLTETQNSDATAYNYEEPIFYISGDITIFDRLSHILGYRGNRKNVIYMGGMNLNKEVPMSKFQLIVDENGDVVNCTLLEASTLNNNGKDKIVKNFLLNNKIFDGPGFLNGEPCKSAVLLTVLYVEDGDVHFRKICYPLVNFAGSETALVNPATSN